MASKSKIPEPILAAEKSALSTKARSPETRHHSATVLDGWVIFFSAAPICQSKRQIAVRYPFIKTGRSIFAATPYPPPECTLAPLGEFESFRYRQGAPTTGDGEY